MTTPPPIPDEPGMIEAVLIRVFGRSYRTTIAGIVALVATLIPLVPGVSPEVIGTAREVAALVGAAGLVVAKDARVSGQA